MVRACRRRGRSTGRTLPQLAHAYYLLHLAYTSLRSPERAAFRDLALPIYEELGDLLGQANVLNNLGIDAYYEGRWHEALDLYERSKEARERIGDVVGAAQITNNIGEVKSDQGYLTTASELFEEARAVFETSGHRFLEILAASNLGRAASRAGRFDDAFDTLDRAYADFQEIRAGSFVLETGARLAERAAFAGDAADAIARADETLQATEETDAGATLRALLHRLRGYALAQSGDLHSRRRGLAAEPRDRPRGRRDLRGGADTRGDRPSGRTERRRRFRAGQGIERAPGPPRRRLDAAGTPLIGTGGFEPPASCSQSRRANQAALRPAEGPV